MLLQLQNCAFQIALRGTNGRTERGWYCSLNTARYVQHQMQYASQKIMAHSTGWIKHVTRTVKWKVRSDDREVIVLWIQRVVLSHMCSRNKRKMRLVLFHLTLNRKCVLTERCYFCNLKMTVTALNERHVIAVESMRFYERFIPLIPGNVNDLNLLCPN